MYVLPVNLKTWWRIYNVVEGNRMEGSGEEESGEMLDGALEVRYAPKQVKMARPQHKSG